MAKKIKLTESQIDMLKSVDTSKTKLKITSEQFDRIFESESPLHGMSKNVTKNFKKFASNIPDSKMKFENDDMGDHPAAGSYVPQTEPENIKTTKSFNEGEERPITKLEFGEQVKSFLKELLTNPSDDVTDNFWKGIGLTKSELVSTMKEIGMLGTAYVNDKKIIKIMKDNFVENIKKLYDSLISHKVDNHVELDELEDKDINADYFKKQITNKPAIKPSQEDIKKKLALVRQKELERRAKENTIEEDGSTEEQGQSEQQPIVGFDILKHFPFTALRDTRSGDGKIEVDNWGAVFVPSINTMDGQTRVDSKQDLVPHEFQGPKMMHKYQGYIEDFKSKFGEYPAFVLNPNGAWYNKVTVINPAYLEAKEKYYAAKGEALKQWKTTENTTAASSGSFEAPITSKSTNSNNSPESEMGQLIDEYDKTTNDVEALDSIKDLNFTNQSFGVNKISDIDTKEESDDKSITCTLVLVNDKNKDVGNRLIYHYDGDKNSDELVFNHKYDKVYDPYEIFDTAYHSVLNKVKEAFRPKGIEEVSTAASSGAYVTPKVWAKDKENMRFGKKPMYPKGQIVDNALDESNMTSTAYPDGKFVKLDDCTKLNNNKKAQNGGCNAGASDVVKLSGSEDSVISDDAVYYEVAKKTGRTIEEVKTIIGRKKGDF